MCTIERSSCIAESAGNFIDNAQRALLEIVGVLENQVFARLNAMVCISRGNRVA